MTTATNSPRRGLKTPEAATYLGLSVSLLRKMRGRGPQDRQPGPAFIRVTSQLIIYEVSELDRWLDEQRARSESTAQ